MDFNKDYSFLKIIRSDVASHIIFFSGSVFFIWFASLFTLYVFPSRFTPMAFYFFPWAFLVILIYHRSQKFKYEDIFNEFIKIIGSLLGISFLFAILVYSVFDQGVENAVWFYGFYYFIAYVFNFFVLFLGVIFALPLIMSNLAKKLAEKITGDRIQKNNSTPFYYNPLYIISLAVSVPLAIYIIGLFPVLVELFFYSGYILAGFFIFLLHAGYLVNAFQEKKFLK